MHRPDNSLGDGVYYRMADHARMTRRLVAYVVDAIVLIVAAIAVRAVCIALMGPIDRLDTWSFLGWLVFSYVYLVVLKPSRLRTLGYIVADLKIVTLTGYRPSLPRMTFRLGLAFVGLTFLCVWFLPLLDLLWVGVDEDSQTLRDRYASTCVVRAKAQPAGRGSIHLARYMALGRYLMFPVVTRPVANKDI